MKRKFKFRRKLQLRVGTLPLAAKRCVVRWTNQPVRSGRAFRAQREPAKD
jgi:hypothetical protein